MAVPYTSRYGNPEISSAEISDRSTYNCFAALQCRWSDAAYFAYEDSVVDNWARIARTTYYGRQTDGSRTLDGTWSITGRLNNADVVYGDFLSKVGRTTGWTRGQVVYTCQDRNNGSGILVCQHRVKALSDVGDSGAPVFMEDESAGTAEFAGILWGGVTDSRGNRLFDYNPIDNIEVDLGIVKVCGAKGC